MIYNDNGSLKTFTVSGTVRTGLQASDGSINIVLNDTLNRGIQHPCGAFRVNSQNSDFVLDSSGAYYLNNILGGRGSKSLVTTGVIVQEGDSITASGGSGYAGLFASANPSLTVHNIAVGGSGMTGVEARQATALAYAPQVLSLFIGANGIEGTEQEYVDRIIAYLAPFKAMGTKTVLCTLLPQAQGDYATFNSSREIVNGLFKEAVGTSFDALADWDATIMGVDATAADTYYFIDGKHPTSAGHAVMLPNYKGAMYAALGLTNEVTPFAFTDVADVPASTVATSDAIKISGLNYGETKAVSVAGGEYSKNGGAFTAAAGTVTNGDTVTVRGTASATASATVDVVLTVGSVSDTFSIDTAALSDVTWIPNLSPPAAIDGAFGPKTYTFPSIAFNAGLGIVFVAMGTRECTSVSVNGVAATLTVAAAAAAGASIWQVDVPTSGSYDVVVGAAAGLAALAIATGTLVGANATATSTAVRLNGAASDPRTTSTPLTIPSGGVGLAVGWRNYNTPFTWNTGTEELDYGSAVGNPIQISTAHFTPGVITPSESSGGYHSSVISAAAWGP